MSKNVYSILSREIEKVYKKYITPAYHYQRFPFGCDVLFDDGEEEVTGFIQREGDNLVVTVEHIGYERCLEPIRFEFWVYDEEEEED